MALTQAALYISTGIWPLVHMKSFVKVTGPKNDYWLVKTVGVLVTVIGGVVGVAGLRRTKAKEIPLLAMGAAAGLTAIDIIYVIERRILPVYLLDALAELGLIGCWAIILKQNFSQENA
ncbi:MAG: hypothetical protein KY468_00250 [Armatimonadetes bacterium]|nr:hypothetical protein [Armatimonadota bacterium]